MMQGIGCSGDKGAMPMGSQCNGMKKEGDGCNGMQGKSCSGAMKCEDGKCGTCATCKPPMGGACKGEEAPKAEGSSCKGTM